MRVKKYLVDSMPEALQKIKSELGKNAVIVNSKEVRTGGFLGMFTKKQIEVIAAMDEAAPSLERTINPTQSHGSTSVNSNGAYRNSPQGPGVALQERTESSSLLLSEITQVKQIMQKMLVQQDRFDPMPAPIRSIADKLMEQGVDEEIVLKIVLEVYDQSYKTKTLSDETAIEMTKQQITELVSRFDMDLNLENKKLIQFVGPTGVGKTTTIAKIAADLMLKKKKKVAFITSDTYRIAAIEQLRTYANILNVPMEVVFTPKEMTKAMNKLKEYDVILMDTAGRNYRNDLFISELNSVLNEHKDSETILVLSLTSKYSDMVAVAEQFKKVRVNRVLFTKADETVSYGAVVNLVSRYSLGLSFLTYGQNVPDDLAILKPKHIADLLLGEHTYV